MTTVTIKDTRRGFNAPTVTTLCDRMTSTLHAQVRPREPYIPGWIVLTVTAPKDRVEIACELWLSAHYENWRVTT
jgi:hypothetical protein